MNIFLELLGLSAITILAVESKPTTWIWYNLTKKLPHKWSLPILDFLRCPLCLGFWIGFMFTLSIPLSAIVSVLASLIHNKIISGGI